MRKALAMLGTWTVLASLAACGAAGGTSGSGANAGGGDSPAVVSSLPPDVRYGQDADVRNYRSDLDALAKRSGNDFLSSIIADNTVTADEMNEAKRRMQQCYADAGYRAVQTDESGGVALARLDGGNMEADMQATNDAQRRCETDSGYSQLVTLYFNAVRNPEHVDLAPYVVQCFIDHQLVDAQYTVADYQRDSQNRTGPYKVQDEDPESAQGRQVTQCGRDPLGKLQ